MHALEKLVLCVLISIPRKFTNKLKPEPRDDITAQLRSVWWLVRWGDAPVLAVISLHGN